MCCSWPVLLDREVKSLFHADDLVVLSPTELGPQQQLDKAEKILSELGPGSEYEEN